MGFELPRFAKCCFCIPLKIGVLLIGYFSMIASCFTLATVSYSIYRVHSYVEETTVRPTPQQNPNQVSQNALSLYISFGYYLLVFLYNFVINLILVIGVHKNNTKYMRFYFTATQILFALSIALVVVTAVFMGFLATVPVLKWSFTLLACLVIVRSYYLSIEEERKKPAVYELQPYTPVPQGPTMA
ncbi:uncharacterized protein LOC113506626 [Trichoplusia ni]|uniref:Uncharacterized protein LOC113503823 n=1 Tax=Trichoplusia ni TaxID=7111 RepID=A0A7E5WYD1_TRINI|nr:uncharacterized protein LOC113503823 [Trichoplusia ni]XP_026745262.1 uncharacterized protein LOC113506626 [Trichoplusia ni]